MSGSGGGNTAIGQPGFNPNGPGNPSFRPPGGVMNQPGFGAQANGSGSAMATGGNYNPNGYAGLQSQGYQGGTGGVGGSATGSIPNGGTSSNVGGGMQQVYNPSRGSDAYGYNYTGDPNATRPAYSVDSNMGGDAGGGPAPVQAGYTGGDQPGGLLGGGFQNNGWGQDVNSMSSTSANPVSPQQMQYIRATQAAHPGMAQQLAQRQAMHGNRGAQFDESGRPIDPNAMAGKLQAGMGLSTANPNAVNPTPTPPAGGFGSNQQAPGPAAPGMYWATGPNGQPIQQPLSNLSNGYGR